MEKDKENLLEKLKKDYSELEKRFSLPSFDNMNKDFGIEKISEIESDYLIREIRKFMAEKFANYLRFAESLLHPVNVPMFVFAVVKNLSSEDVEKLKSVYKSLAKVEIELVELDLEFDEQKEAQFVNDSYKMWQENKAELLKVVGVIRDKWDKKFEVNGQGKGYFG